MKKNLVFISNEIAKDKGGIQNMCFYLSEAFLAYFNLTIICSADSEVDSIANAKVIRSRYSSTDLNKFRKDIIYLLFEYYKDESIDFVLTAQYCISSCCYLLKKIHGVPYGILAHGNEVYGNVGSGRWKTIFLNRFRKTIIGSSDVIFANSVYTRSLVFGICAKANIIVVHPPIGFHEERILEISTQKEKYELFSLARHVERKGLQLVIQSFPLLLEKYPKLHYNIGGDGDYTPILKKLVCNLHLEDKVFFLGALSEEEKQEYMRKCSLFVMPSFSIPNEHSVEGFGIVYIEANSYGKFVIGSKSGGVPDAIKNGVTGFLAEENNVQSVAKCIDDFFDSNFSYNPHCCMLWAKEHFVDVIVKTYYKEISRIINHYRR